MWAQQSSRTLHLPALLFSVLASQGKKTFLSLPNSGIKVLELRLIGLLAPTPEPIM